MNRTWICCLIGLISLGSAALSQAQTTGDTEKTVAALEQKWLEAQKSNNPEILVPLLADKFVETDSEGKVTDKAETLANAKATKYASAEYNDVKVTAFGNTAIATGGFKGKVTDASGKTNDVNERWTDTWIKMPTGKWQCIASHASAIKS
jgi:ketosteroid isomerase-like protein